MGFSVRKLLLAAWMCLFCPAVALANELQISGVPPDMASAGTPYAFRPAFLSIGTDPYLFVVSNAPPWVGFSSTDGSLSGNPQVADSGIYPNIEISLIAGPSNASLPSFTLRVYPFAAAAAHTLIWAAATANEDGTALQDLAGYYIYAGASADTLVPIGYVPAGTCFFLLGPQAATANAFAVSAVNTSGVESDRVFVALAGS